MQATSNGQTEVSTEFEVEDLEKVLYSPSHVETYRRCCFDPHLLGILHDLSESLVSLDQH